MLYFAQVFGKFRVRVRVNVRSVIGKYGKSSGPRVFLPDISFNCGL